MTTHKQAAAFWHWLSSDIRVVLLPLLSSAFALLVLLGCAVGLFRQPEPSLLTIGTIGALVGLLILRLYQRLRGHTSSLSEWELGTLCIGGTFVLIELSGGPAGLLFPFVYVLVSFLVVFHARWQSIMYPLLIVATEAGIVAWQDGESLRRWVSHASFVLLFAFLYRLLVRSEIVLRRQNIDLALDKYIQDIRTEAEEFRLTSGLGIDSRDLPTSEHKKRREVSSVQAIHESVYNVLGVAERALQPHTVALLWLSADGRTLRVKELRTRSDDVHEKPIGCGEGFLGAVVKRNLPLVLKGLKPYQAGLPYYSRPQPVTDFAAVPVLEGEHLRGVLVADRIDGKAFDEGERGILETIAQEVLRAVQVERVLIDMDREKTQKERFYQASRDFNSARTVDQVAEIAIGAARRVTESEFAAVAVATEEEGKLVIGALEWAGHPDEAKLVGQSFLASDGLVGAAIKARHALPHGTTKTQTQRIFASDLSVGIPHIKVLPLIWKNQGVGALVVGSERPDFLSPEIFEMVRVISDHAAIAIANAQMYERMERMATTDGLTGLANHRQFQELFDASVAAADRYQRPLSLLLCDIDHFKVVNDTHGHPVGDRVLKRVAEILRINARRTDVVARYGGEEFAVVMSETHQKGAYQIAERIRVAIEAEVFRCEQGAFSCTLSLGLATFPVDGTYPARLAECADQALYEAKHEGRNRTISFATLQQQRRQKKAS